MKNNFDFCLAEVLKSEGGYVFNKNDPGGMTNLGCTKAVWEEFVGHPVSETDMRALTPKDVAPLYKRKYWDKISGDQLPAGLDYAVFDAAINSGPGRAAKWLQEVVGVQADGVIGYKTIVALQETPLAKILSLYNDKRLQFLENLPHFATFGKGWSNRVSSVQTISSSMLT
jgi:lysozyme family protein